jgi:hypothetical protein
MTARADSRAEQMAGLSNTCAVAWLSAVPAPWLKLLLSEAAAAPAAAAPAEAEGERRELEEEEEEGDCSCCSRGAEP